jgi:hypothetical protein
LATGDRYLALDDFDAKLERARSEIEGGLHPSREPFLGPQARRLRSVITAITEQSLCSRDRIREPLVIPHRFTFDEPVPVPARGGQVRYGLKATLAGGRTVRPHRYGTFTTTRSVINLARDFEGRLRGVPIMSLAVLRRADLKEVIPIPRGASTLRRAMAAHVLHAAEHRPLASPRGDSRVMG